MSFCRALVQRRSSGFPCLAPYVDLGKSAILFVVILAIVRKTLHNYRRVISGLHRDSISLLVHQSFLAALLLWAIAYAIFWTFEWETGYDASERDASSPTSRVWHVLSAMLLCALYAATEALDTTLMYLIASNSLGRSWLRRLYIVGASVFGLVFAALACATTAAAGAQVRDPVIILQSRPIAAVFIAKDAAFLLQCLVLGSGVYHYLRIGARRKASASRPTVRRALARYLRFMVPVRGLLAVGRVAAELLHQDGGFCVTEASFYLYFTLFGEVAYRCLRDDCTYWSQNCGLESAGDDGEEEDDEDSGLKESLKLNDWTERALSSEAAQYAAARIIARTELYFRGKMQEKANSTVEVYLWRRRKVVVKFATLDILTQDNILLFRKEASVAMALSHPHIVKHFGVTPNPPRLGLVLEYCRQGDLFSVLQTLRRECEARRSSLAPPAAGEEEGREQQQQEAEGAYNLNPVRVLREVASALRYVHAQSVVHRDVKSLNILLDHRWRAKLADFGDAVTLPGSNLRLALGDADPEAGESGLPSSNEFVGTPSYGAPELFLTDEEERNGCRVIPSPKNDVYSFGVVMWEVLTLLPPRVLATEADRRELGLAAPLGTDVATAARLSRVEIQRVREGLLLVAQRRYRPPRLREFPPWLQPLVDLMERAWAHNPAHRPSMDKIERELDALLRAETGSLAPHPWPLAEDSVHQAPLEAAAPSPSPSSPRGGGGGGGGNGGPLSPSLLLLPISGGGGGSGGSSPRRAHSPFQSLAPRPRSPRSRPASPRASPKM